MFQENDMATWTFNSVISRPVNADASTVGKSLIQKWRSGIFGCFNYPMTCLSVCFCEPCTVGQVSSIGRGGHRNTCIVVTGLLSLFLVIGTAVQYIDSSNAATAATTFMYISAGLTIFAILYARVQIRNREKLQGSFFGDIFYSLCCSGCSICQMLNQYQPYRGFWSTYEVLDEETGTA